MYKVIAYFTDLQDNDFKYLPGMEYPRKGYTPSPERIRELATAENQRGVPLIKGDGKEIIKEEAKPVEVEEVSEENEEVSEEIKEVPDDFMNPPTEEEPAETEAAPKKRGRKKNAD